ncbi:MerR family DNA-binding transcriptional regulator [Pseudonocardiaceae bacterium YIM PH 21723]|nr:MerR family DNA-binding transcriptional regulator [Pseudonocardiaceae bacterium YIM PH 21723]
MTARWPRRSWAGRPSTSTASSPTASGRRCTRERSWAPPVDPDTVSCGCVPPMLSIGDLAAQSGVSVRMLRHYDALGLVVPHRIDPATGYRWYAPAQLGRVISLVEYRALGFSLDQCRILLGELSAQRLAELLEEQRTVLETRIDADTRRLAGVRRRLLSLESGLAMTADSLRFQPLSSLRISGLRGEVGDISEVGAMADSLQGRLAALVDLATVEVISSFVGHPEFIEVLVGVPGQWDGLESVELPAIERAAVVTHSPGPDDPDDPWLTVEPALAERGLRSAGPYRRIERPGAAAVELHCAVLEQAGSAN